MKAKNFIVKFFRKAEKYGDKDQFLGHVEIDDAGTIKTSLVAKAFRQAPPRCLQANKVKVERTG